MHQDIFRLAVHRSLSKNLNTQEVNNKISPEKRDKEKEKYKEEKVKVMPRRDSTELQIHKNYATNLGFFSKNFAETLLRGAIDLQVSIEMLESFQENINRRKKCHGKGVEIEGFVGGLNANRYISNTEGLKKVIKESLYKQNLIIDSSDEKSSFNYNNTPGIVAKLMGVENFQSMEKDAKGKNLSSPRTVFELERMPRVRKEKLPQERIDPNGKALLDIMESLQFRRLMRNNQGEREDQNAKLDRNAKWEVKTFEEAKIETSKIVKINNATKKGLVRRPSLSVKKNEEKNGVNSTASKSVQRRERKSVVVPMRNESCNKLEDRKIKREGKGFNPKIQKKNGGTINIRTRHIESDSELKRLAAVPSMEDHWINWSVSYESFARHQEIKEEEEEKESIDFSERAENDLTLLLLGNKSFNTFAKGDLKLCLDIAREQISRKNSRNNLLYQPPYHVGTITRIPCFSIHEKLVGEITNGIRNLNGYKNPKKSDALKDGLYWKLERDLKCLDLGINSIWDFGWLDWICVEEASNLVCYFADYVLCFLIEEVYLDLFTF